MVFDSGYVIILDMLAADVFRASEMSALTPAGATAGGGSMALGGAAEIPSPINSVTGVSDKGGKGKAGAKRKASMAGASIFIVGMFAVLAFSIGAPSFMIDAFHERLIEEEDRQYAASKEATILVLEKSLEEGDVADDTAEKLEKEGWEIGYRTESGEFVKDHKIGRSTNRENEEIAAVNYTELAYEDDESFVKDNKAGMPLVIRKGDKEIAAADFAEAAHADVDLYNAINKATYDRAKLYYDEAANNVIKEMGIERNDFSSTEDFETTVNKKSCNGSDVTIENAWTPHHYDESTGENVADGDDTTFGSVSSTTGDAQTFVEGVADITRGGGAGDATEKAAAEIQDAEAQTRSQCDGRIFLLMQETVEIVKDGEDPAKAMVVHDMMNRLTERVTTEVMNPNTGEVEKVTKSAMESPSLSAALAGNKLQAGSTDAYSLERVTNTVKDGVAALKRETGEDTLASLHAGGGSGSRGATKDSVSSVDMDTKENGGRHNGMDDAEPSKEILGKVESMVDSSMMSNNFADLRGEALGEAIENGAHYVSSEIARRGSGATPMSMSMATAYTELNEQILALDAKADRLNRSPLDITSKNTFLGSIVHEFAMISLQNQDLMSATSGINNFASLLGSAISGLFTPASADGADGYLAKNMTTSCGDEGGIGAVATPKCQTIYGFDPSIFNDTFNNPEFRAMVESSTEMQGSQRVIKDNTVLAEAVLNSNNRQTGYGMVDGAILQQEEDKITAADKSGEEFNFFGVVGDIFKAVTDIVTNIMGMITNLYDAESMDDPTALNKALGANYVASESNPDWETNKWAQAWSAIYRVVRILQDDSTDLFAYRDLEFFEGDQDIVAEFLERHYSQTQSEIAANAES